MSDEELVRRLVRFEGKTCVSSDDEVLAAHAIERLTRERDEWIAKCRQAVWAESEELKFEAARAEAAERKVEKLWEALSFVGNIAHAEGDTAGICDIVRAALAETENGDG